MTTTFDTSGSVGIVEAAPQGGSYCQTVRWRNLSPFTQGYIEALFADDATQDALMDEHGRVRFGFSDLAPETLARIIADCEAGGGRYPEGLSWQGGGFWNRRQLGFVHWAPPLTVQLGDDGKVRFAVTETPDARLMAAAPDMLAALKELRAATPGTATLKAARVKADAAIAKATGA